MRPLWLMCAMFVVATLWLVPNGPARAQVQTSNACRPSADGTGCYQGEAYAVCMQTAQAAFARLKVVDPGAAQNVTSATCLEVYSGWSGFSSYLCMLMIPGSHYNCDSYASQVQYHFLVSRSCAANNTNFPPGDAQGQLGQPPSDCYGGCKLTGTPTKSTAGGVTTYGVINRTYTGEVCTKQNNSNAPIDAQQDYHEQTPEVPKTPECTALGNGQTGCVKANGDYCATASTGKSFCWTPTETGKKSDGTEAQVKSPKGDAVTPPSTSISDKEWQRTEGHQMTACVNDTCTTYNVTNYTSVPAGTAKNSTGDNASDGTGNTSGNGGKSSSGKDGDDDKDSDSASDSGNCTTPPVCVGDTLKCLHLKYTWKVQCNTERGEVEGGATCGDGDIPVCTGKSCKAAEYAQVLQQWRSRCAAEKEREAAGRDAATGEAEAAGDDEAGAVAKLWEKDKETGPAFDETRISIGGGDLLGGNVTIAGQEFKLNQQFYDAIAIIRKIIIATAILVGLGIVWRS